MIVAVIVVVAIVVFSAIAILANQPRATCVGITRDGVSGNSMFFNVTIRTSGAAIDADQLHVDLRSGRAGVTFDEIVYYNLERIPGGTLFIWDLDIAIDPFGEPSFSYEFMLEVNGSRMNLSTVT